MAYRPHISKLEFQKVRMALGNRGFSKSQRDRVEEVFRGDLAESGDFVGIDQTELENGLKWLRENKSKHHFSDNQINIIEEEMAKWL